MGIGADRHDRDDLGGAPEHLLNNIAKNVRGNDDRRNLANSSCGFVCVGRFISGRRLVSAYVGLSRFT